LLLAQPPQTITGMDIEIAYDPMDAATELLLRSKEELIRQTPRPDSDSLRWRVEQRGRQAWVILSRFNDPKDVLFEHPRDYFQTLKDDELRNRIGGIA
jgi:hypothetical protein